MKPVRRDSVLRAAFLMTGSVYIAYALSLITSALIARTLGPAAYGQYTFVVWLSGMLTIVANNGLNTTGIRFVSEFLGQGETSTAHRAHGWLLVRQRWVTLAVGVGFVLLMPFFMPAGWEEGPIFLFAIVIVSMATKSSYIFDISMAKGYGRFGIEAMIMVFASLIAFAIVVVLYFFDGSLSAFMLVFAFACIVHWLGAMMLLRKHDLRPQAGPLPAEELGRVKKHLVWTIALAFVAAIGDRSIEIWLLNAYAGSAAVGFFAIAAALTKGGVDLLSSGLSTVLLPSMAHAFGAEGADGVRLMLRNAVRYFHFLGLMLAGVGLLLAPAIVLLMYGTEFQSVLPVLYAMLVLGGLTLSEGAFGAVLTTTDHQSLRAGFTAFSIVVSGGVAVLMIPQYGLNGAIASYVISRLVVFAFLIIGIKHYLGISVPWREVSRLTLAGLLAAAGVFGLLLLVGDTPWIRVVVMPIYLLTLTLASLELGAWQRGDLQRLATALVRFPRIAKRVGPWLQRYESKLPG